MKKLILAMLLTISITANAQEDKTWMDSIQKVQDSVVYYEDENGYLQKWGHPKKYEDWTCVDENGYDYTIKIIIE